MKKTYIIPETTIEHVEMDCYLGPYSDVSVSDNSFNSDLEQDARRRLDMLDDDDVQNIWDSF